MHAINDRKWVNQQYQSDRNLNVRMALHQRFSTSKTPWHRWVFDQLLAALGERANGPLRILELGAGPGTLWAENQGRIPKGWNVTLSDLSPGMAMTARRNLEAAGCVASYVVANAERIPAATGSCDAVVANHMLYHVPDRSLALDEIRRVLRAEGVLAAATNGVGHMAELHELAHRFDPLLPGADPSPSRFSFEDGLAELGARFEQAELVHDENRLVVTEAEPLAAYMLSGMPEAVRPLMQAARRRRLRRFLAAEMAKTGAIHITPVTGILVARRPR